MVARVRATVTVSEIAFVVTAASAIDTAVLPQAAAEFGVSDVLDNYSIHLAGFAAGAFRNIWP